GGGRALRDEPAARARSPCRLARRVRRGARARLRQDRGARPVARRDLCAVAGRRQYDLRHDAAAGWTMIVVGIGVGFLFALAVLAISVVSFPLLLDRDVGFDAAVLASLRAVAVNPVAMIAWGGIVALGLVLGSIPAFLGLVIVVPVLGHATWHLYRKVVI